MRIDYHTHILPGVDDGSRSVEESLAMLREEARQGVEAVVLTPHFYADQNDIDRFLRRRAAAWERLQQVLTLELPKLLLGAEVHYFEGICQTEDLQRLCIGNTNLLLLEMPFFRWSERMRRDVLTLQEQGDVQVILAHVERYIRTNGWQFMELLRRSGVLIQANAALFLDWKTRHRAVKLVREGRIQLLASDCHNMKTRAPNLGKAYQVLGEHAAQLRTYPDL